MDIVFAKDRNKKPNPFMGLWKKVVEKFKNFRFSNTFYYFLILIVISIGFYMLMLVQNGFTLASVLCAEGQVIEQYAFVELQL